MFDGEAFGAEIVAQVRGYCERAVAPLVKRIEQLESRESLDLDALAAALTERGFVHVDGVISKADFDALADKMETSARSAVQEAVDVAVKALPVAKDGKNADPDAIDLMIAQAVARIPAPKDGTSVTVDDVAPLISEAVEKAVASIPAPKDGVGLAGAVIGREGNLIVTLTDGQTRDLGPVVGRDGIDAKGDPGRDALQLTDFDSALSEDGRFLILSLESDDLKVTHELQLPTMIYRGVFKDGGAYLPGDMVTWAGSLWHCDAETSDKPGEGAKSWTLAAKKGRDGKDAPK